MVAGMLILIDGYNVIAPVAAPGRSPPSDWLHTERMQLLKRLARQLDPQLASRTHVIFDSAAPPHRGADAFEIDGIHVRFAVDHDQADDLIEELIAAHHSPKQLTVVSSDHRLQVAARRAGAVAFDAQPWLDALLDGKLMLATTWPPVSGSAEASSTAADLAKPQSVDEAEVQEWIRRFGISDRDVDQLSEPDPTAVQGSALSAGGKTEPTGQGRGGGRAGDPPQQVSSRAKPRQGREPKRDKDTPEGRLPDDFNPFPEGYAEDLLP